MSTQSTAFTLLAMANFAEMVGGKGINASITVNGTSESLSTSKTLANRELATKTFRILLHASYLGRYYLPGIQVEAMYDNDYMVRTQGQWVEVVQE
ncbi:hypothetical protein SAMN05421636_101406 [Pricia antarctica]|uniref:Uncharacterized protein n=1 Tax=Pricia antarctica TaxID=641691 RepID=A0A1G6WU83_9FLAO|nr:hypothetical protein [Pricia antarctica]SDD68585.1 hypothetical protein SAMN05421636_101406 [Pricia antarctica]